MDKKSKSLARLRMVHEHQLNTLKRMESIPLPEVRIELPLLKATESHFARLIQCVEEDLPTVLAWYSNGPEIFNAMDLDWFHFALISNMVSTSIDLLVKDLERADQMIPPDVCTVHRLIVRAVEDGDMPVPTLCIPMLQPCDGITTMHNVVSQNKDWANVKFFAPDPPYIETDPRAVPYFAAELKRMVRFIEKNLGKRLDLDRLREIIEETNKQVRMILEFNELKRAIPCPVPSFGGSTLMPAMQGIPTTAGLPAGTDYIRGKLAHIEEMVKAKKGAVPNEKIRVYWLDGPPGYHALEGWGPWLAQEWGAVIVHDIQSATPYEVIDTSTEESMFLGLAKRTLFHSLMNRQSRGMVNLMLDDLVRGVKDFKIDCVIHAGHMGHKDHAANVGIVREVCRDLGVPMMFLGMDLFDPRYTPFEEVKKKISQFFMAMGLGQR